MSSPPAPTARRMSTSSIVVVGLLLALPVVALAWVSSYNRATPALFGFPFFYWYQFMWVPLAAICTSAAYRVAVGGRAQRDDATDVRRTDDEAGR